MSQNYFICTASTRFPDITVDGYYSKGSWICEGYWKQLCHCADARLGISFDTSNENVYWNIPRELEYARNSSTHKLMMALAFIANCSFGHSVASFRPFKDIPHHPSYHKVIDKYEDLLQNGVPQAVEITSTLMMAVESTMFKRVPFKVVQHATLNTATFELTHTYAEVIWDDGAAPEICSGTFVPREQCEWRHPNHP